MSIFHRQRLALIPLIAASLAMSGCGAFKGSGKSKIHVGGDRVAILTGESGIEAEPSLAGVPVSLPVAMVNDSWGQPGGNAAKSMGNLGLGATLNIAWRAGIAGGSKSAHLAASPVVANGTLYAMGTDGRVTALDTRNGGRRWSVAFGSGGKNRNSIFGGGVSVEGDVLYVTNGLGDVGALKASDGSVIWQKKLGTPLRGAPTIAFGNIYVMSQDNQLFTLRTSDGNIEWSEAAAVQMAGVFGVAAPAAGQGTIVAGFSSGDLTAYRYENGRTVWQDTLTRTSISTAVGTLSDIDADPVIDSGRVYTIGAGGRMVGTELVTGQRLWELNIAGVETPWVAGDWLFVVTDDARLLCIARATGKVRWISQLQHYRGNKASKGMIGWAGPVLAGDRLILANSEGDLVMVSPADGHVLTSSRLGSPVSLQPVVANNTLYILGDDGRITALR